jgi:hypothetical protein
MVARVVLATDSTVVVNSSNTVTGLQFQVRSSRSSSDSDSNINGGKNNTVVISDSSRELEKQTV